MGRMSLHKFNSILIIMYIIYSVIGYIYIPKYASYVSIFFVGAIILISSLIIFLNRETNVTPICLGWIVFFVFSISHPYSGFSSLINDGLIHLFSFVLVMISLKSNRENLDKTLNFLGYFVLLLGLFTIYFAFDKKAYENYLNLFMNEEIRTQLLKYYSNNQYAGLLMHYSTNAIFLAVGFLYFAIKCMVNRRKLLNYFWLAIIAVSLLICGKRSALVFSIVAFLCIFIFWALKHEKNFLVKILFFLLVFGISVVVIINTDTALGNTLTRIIDGTSDTSFGGRSILYDLAIDMISKKPLFGYGWGSYKQLANLGEIGIIYGSDSNMYAHNCYLQVFAEMGIVGLLLFVVLLVSPILLYAKYIINRKDISVMHLFAFSYQIYFILYCTLGNPLYDYCTSALYFLSVGIILGMRKESFYEENWNIIY